MINKKIIVLIAAAVLVCSLGLGATYAWFTSRAEADLAGGLYGAKGGLAFGSLNVDLKVDSHLQAINAAGTPIGTPIPVGSGDAMLVYPGSIVMMDENGDVTNSDSNTYKSVLTYTVINNSQSDALARIDHVGLGLNGDNGKNTALTIPTTPGATAIDSLIMNLYRLLGAAELYHEAFYSGDTNSINSYLESICNNEYTTVEDFELYGPTFFRYAKGFGGAGKANETRIVLYLNYQKLVDHGFTLADAYNLDKVYNAPNFDEHPVYKAYGGTLYNADGASMPLYGEPTSIQFDGNDGLKFTASVDNTLGRGEAYNYNDYTARDETITSSTSFNKYTDCKVLTSTGGIYIYMPSNGQTTITLELRLNDATNPKYNYDNTYHFAVYKVFMAGGDPSATKLTAYGVEPVKAAIMEYFNAYEGINDTTTTTFYDKLNTGDTKILP